VLGKNDSVDSALDSLRSESWTGNTPNRAIEEKLMTEFHVQRTKGGIRRYRTLLIALAAVLVGSVGFAAAGGTDLITQWVTVRIVGTSGSGDDMTVDLMLTPVEDGTASGSAVIQSDGKNLALSVEQTDDGQKSLSVSIDAAGAEGGSTYEVSANTVTLTELKPGAASKLMDAAGRPDAETVKVEIESGAAVPADQLQGRDDVIETEWQDGDGVWHGMKLVPSPRANGRMIYTLLREAPGALPVLGAIQTNAAIAEVLDAYEDDGTLVVEATTADGADVVLEVTQPNTRSPAKSNAASRTADR